MIFQLIIFKDDTYQTLDLPTDFNMGFVLKSGFLGKVQTGSFSMQSSLPATPNNCQILQNAENPQVLVNRNIQYPAKLLFGSSEFYAWYFVLREAQHNGYKFDLIQTPGNQARNFFEKKLWQLDFGKTELQSYQEDSGIWTVDLYGDTAIFKHLLSKKSVYFEIYINGVLTIYPQLVGFIDSDRHRFWDIDQYDAETRFNFEIKNDEYTVVLSRPTPTTGSLNVIAKTGPAITSVTFKMYQYTYKKIGGIQYIVTKGTLLGLYNLQQLRYDYVSPELYRISKNQNLYPFKFIQYNSDGFYPSDNIQYEGIVNQYVDGNLRLNRGIDFVTYPISPCFSLGWILDKVAAMMGFELVSDIFQNRTKSGDMYLGELYLLNNCDLSEQLAGTTFPYNTYGKTINYNYFMPDMTVKEFIDAVRSICLSVEYDYQEGKMFVNPCKETFLSGDVIDISQRISRFPECQILDKTYYQLRFKNGDDKIISQFSFPTDDSISDDGNDYTKIEVGFTPALNNIDLDPFLTVDYNPGVPTASETARSTIYPDQKGNHPIQKMCFFKGFDAQGKSIADNKNDKICLSFADQGLHRGLLNTFYKEYLEFLNQTFQWTADITLSEMELANFKFAQKYWAYGTIFIPESLSPKLPIKDKMKISLLSL